MTRSGVTNDGTLVAFGATPRRFAAQGADFAFEVAHAGLTGVSPNHLTQRIRRELHVIRRETVVLDLLLDQVVGGDLQLLFFGVAGDFEHFHPIPQCSRHRIEDVGGRDEQHLGQIERDVEVVIAERVVLLGIEDFEEGRRWIAAKIRSELVDLVEDEDRILRLGSPQPLHDLAGQGADVGPPVPADFCFVAHAAEGHANELAAE